MSESLGGKSEAGIVGELIGWLTTIGAVERVKLAEEDEGVELAKRLEINGEVIKGLRVKRGDGKTMSWDETITPLRIEFAWQREKEGELSIQIDLFHQAGKQDEAGGYGLGFIRRGDAEVWGYSRVMQVLGEDEDWERDQILGLLVKALSQLRVPEV